MVVGAQSYAEMMARYTEFMVFLPGARATRFTGERGESETYDALMRVPNALIGETVLAADLGRCIRGLVRGHYTNTRPELQVQDGASHTYSGELDGKRIYVEFYVSNGRLMAHAHEDRYAYAKGTEVEMEVVRTGNDFDARVRGAVGPSRYASIAGDIGALARASSGDDRVVCVTDLRVSPLRWSEWPLRMMHAAVALSARLGLITGASLVTIDKRGYGLSLMPCPQMLERGLAELRRYRLEPIGRHLLVARADELVNRLDSFHAHAYTRTSQLGIRS